MIAQLYTDHDPILRIFDGQKMLADIELDWIAPPFLAPRDYRPRKDVTVDGARRALRRMNLQTTSKWIKREWGYEVRVSFIRLCPRSR